MGVASAENSDTAADMTTAKPRERQFQVVPVPGKFTRGRWQCWDYRDDKPDVSEKILDFTDKSEKNVAPSTVNAEAQSNTNATSNITSQLSADCASAAHPIIEQPQTILKAQQQPAGNAVVNAVNATQNQADISLSTSTSTQQALAHKESSTIVVTSIAPAPVTPVHRTSSSSIDIDDTTNVPDNADNLANIQVPSTVTIVNEEEAELDGELCESSRRSSLLSQSSETTETKSTKSCSTTISIPVGAVTLPDNVDSSPYYSISPSLPAVPANSFVNPSLISAIHHSASHQRECAFQSATDAELSRQTSIASFHDGSMNSNPATALNKIDATIDDSLATGNLPGGPNVVAIDNKIEQAMDLVKTHLTFAVREEVELLRSTIVELEAKVAQLESQNQVLKQFAPAEVVANLALLVQNAQQQKQLQQLQQQAQIVTLPPVSGTSLVPPVISSAQPVVVNATPLTTHPFQLGQVASDELQSSVGVIPVPNTSTATDSNSNQITSTSMPSATDITTTSQLSSTLDSMVVNLSSSTSSTNTAAK